MFGYALDTRKGAWPFVDHPKTVPWCRASLIFHIKYFLYVCLSVDLGLAGRSDLEWDCIGSECPSYARQFESKKRLKLFIRKD